MTYGVFDPNYTGQGHQRFIRSINDELDQSFLSPVGQMFFLNGCAGVTIKDLELDGNSGKYILGGPTDDFSGIQLHSDGIRLGVNVLEASVNTQISIKNVNAHHFGRDGFTLTRGGEEMDLVVENCHFDYNGRTGFVWNNGGGLQVVNTTFNFNATGRIQSTMASGLNIEYDEGVPMPSDGHFIDCSFHHNRDAGVQTGIDDVESDVTFEQCSFKSLAATYTNITDPSSHSAFVEFTRALRFTDCEFVGPARVGFNSVQCASQVEGDLQQFLRCTFSEESLGYSYFDWRRTDFPMGVMAPAMVYGNGISGTRFAECRFSSNCRARFVDFNGLPAPQGCTPCVNDVVIKDCVFLNTGLWAGDSDASTTMFFLAGAQASTTWNANQIYYPSMVRPQQGPLTLTALNYDNGELFPGNLSTCSDNSTDPVFINDPDLILINDPEDAIIFMEQYFADNPCLDPYPAPQTPREVPFARLGPAVTELLEKYPCNKLGKSNGVPVAQEAITAVVRNGTLSVQLPGTTQVGPARIYDCTGKTVGHVTVVPGANEFPLHHFAVGSYILHWAGATAPVRFVVTP
jgi:hypothetical protein